MATKTRRSTKGRSTTKRKTTASKTTTKRSPARKRNSLRIKGGQIMLGKAKGNMSADLPTNAKNVGLMAVGGVATHAVDNAIQINAKNDSLRKYSNLLIAVLLLLVLTKVKGKSAKLIITGATVVAFFRFVRQLLTQTTQGQKIAAQASNAANITNSTPTPTTDVQVVEDASVSGMHDWKRRGGGASYHPQLGSQVHRAGTDMQFHQAEPGMPADIL